VVLDNDLGAKLSSYRLQLDFLNLKNTIDDDTKVEEVYEY